MDEAVLAVLMVGLILLVPVAGITARFALKPLIDSIGRIAEMRRSPDEVRALERRVAALETELRGMRDGMQLPAGRVEPHPVLQRPTQVEPG